MNYKDLIIFESIFRNGSFNAASKELKIAQPTISRTINNIEAKYNISLFVRSTRDVIPTQKAIELYELSKETIQLYNDLENVLIKCESIPLNISASINLHRHFFPLYTVKMKELYPNIALNVEANTNDEVINKVLKNKTNLGFIDKNITHKDLVVHN
ncbi:MAG: LysR family transcriptional regulator, partial [Erysipelotrichaceae bacterium]